ncbi:hypothetical protein B0H65DRAFT_413636 [Neurospora tetraspora]|uniref:Uncharacterized protein n=1 Tax=Neurospora tetraspora TaxID=94610 RepID=A0AAE0MWP8_9PEZI|nr:hypothetical protein B0H65DRAFT_413636 [Neurospora tetraspora]
MSANPDSVTNQGEFHSKVPPSKPQHVSGHRLGPQVGNEAAPEFHAKTFPPGTAPEKDSYQPNPIHETPGQALNPDVDPSSRTDPLDAYRGSTSQSIYNQTQYGQPMQGQTSRELHGMHAGKRKKEHSGLEGVGATDKHAETVEHKVRELAADKPEPIRRGIRGEREGAEYSLPETAERVATEHKKR